MGKHKYALLVRLLLLLLSAAYNHQAEAQICAAPPDDGGDFTCICNRYEFNESYYPGAQDWALSVTLVATVDHLNYCLESPYGQETGIVLWLIHYSTCKIGPVDDCRDCLKAAGEIIKECCPNKIGAQAASVDCCARYEQYRFCKLS